MTPGFLIPLVVYILFVLILGVLIAIAFRQIRTMSISPGLQKYIYAWLVVLIVLVGAGGYIAVTFDGDWRHSPTSTIADFQSELIY